MGSGQTEGHTHTHTYKYTHRQRYMLVTVEMDMIQLLSFKLEKKWGENTILMNVNHK